MRTVTFYSYKGGSGRSLLLANAARFLALAGKRVIALDLDFEAPGLHYKLDIVQRDRRSEDVMPERGVVDYILAANAGNEPGRLRAYAIPVMLPPGSGELWLMPAGAAPSGSYWRSLTKLAKRGMLSDPDGLLIADFLELKFRLEDELDPDFLLIDARTGITELTGIATTLLADAVVCLMLDNPESLAGTRAVLRSFGRAIRLEEQKPIETIAVLSRVPARDPLVDRRVHEYLCEPDANGGETLTIDPLFVLPEEPDANRAEPSLIERGRESAGSTLGRGFTAILRCLDPGLGPPTRALRRQQAADALRTQLTSGIARTPDGHALRFPDDQIEMGVGFGQPWIRPSGWEEPSDFADLVGYGHDGFERLVAEYVDDLSSNEERIEWWFEQLRNIDGVLLFTIDWEGRLQRRLLQRRTDRDPDAQLREPRFEEVELT